MRNLTTKQQNKCASFTHRTKSDELLVPQILEKRDQVLHLTLV